MKRSALFLLLMFLLIGNLFIVGANSQDDSEEESLSSGKIPLTEINPETGLPYDVDKVKEIGDEFQDLSIENLEDWLDEWKIWFLSFKIISAIDEFFKKISIVFVILFGQEYEFSLTLLLAISLWVVFFIYLSKILELYSAFSSGISYIIGLAVTIIGAQLGIFGKISDSIIWAVLYLIRMLVFKENITWTERLIIIGIYAVGIFVIVIVLLAFGKWWKKTKEEKKLKREKGEIEVAAKVSQGIVKGATE